MSDKKAQRPYFIENISMNIYSIEELCYYLYTYFTLLIILFLMKNYATGSEMSLNLCIWLQS